MTLCKGTAEPCCYHGNVCKSNIIFCPPPCDIECWVCGCSAAHHMLSGGRMKGSFSAGLLSTALSGFSSQATDELGVPQGPAIHLALGCFVQQIVNRWAFVSPLTSVDPPSPQWASSPALTMCSGELIQPYPRYLCFMSGFMSVLLSLLATWWKRPRWQFTT